MSRFTHQRGDHLGEALSVGGLFLFRQADVRHILSQRNQNLR